jgi:tRNA A-37 threonylcarbamoyl transferase component Bud32
MDQRSEPADKDAAPGLCREFENYRIITDAAYERMEPCLLLNNTREVHLVSETFRRKVYAVRTASVTFFLKISPVLRKKDQLRFLLLPWRITTEWRNLARLRSKNIAAPERVLFGYQGLFPNHGFFIVTRDVRGAAVDCLNPREVLKLPGFLAALHARGILHRDIHPGNILLDHNGSPVLLDAQEIYFLPWLPRRLKVANLGQLWWHLSTRPGCPVTLVEFLTSYNNGRKGPVSAAEVEKIAHDRWSTYYRSRSKRCCKNSSEFQIVKNGRDFRGFRRRDFLWGKADLQAALAHGTKIKDDRLIAYKNVCVKINPQRRFHQDRALASWKMSRAIAVRGIDVPLALAYFALPGTTYFLSVFHGDSRDLNDYLSALTKKEKKGALNRFADWLRTCHGLNIWQRDFKSTNVLVRDNQFMMVDLEGVSIRKNLPWGKKLINLAQLNASISHRLTVKDRLRFFHFYCGTTLPSRGKRRRAYKKIWKITKKKNTLPFNLDLEQLLLKRN